MVVSESKAINPSFLCHPDGLVLDLLQWQRRRRRSHKKAFPQTVCLRPSHRIVVHTTGAAAASSTHKLVFIIAYLRREAHHSSLQLVCKLSLIIKGLWSSGIGRLKCPILASDRQSSCIMSFGEGAKQGWSEIHPSPSCCIRMYLNVFDFIRLYSTVFDCIRLYSTVVDCSRQ